MSSLMPKIFRTSKTRVGSLQSFKNEKSASDKEPEVNKEEVTVEESGLGDVFQEIYGESGTEVKPDEIPENSSSKPHVRPDDMPEDFILEQDESPAARKQYSGEHVQEGINSTEAAEVESSDLDDLISQVMDIPADENSPPSSPKRPTSTPSKDYGDDADFGDGLSLIRGDDEGPEVPAGKANQRGTEEDKNRNRRSEGRDETSRKPMAYRDSSKPSSTITTTTSTISYSSRFVPSIPDSFYKEIQSRLEDLIFKFECLDNEYAALQKISHNIRVETTDVKKKLTSED